MVVARGKGMRHLGIVISLLALLPACESDPNDVELAPANDPAKASRTTPGADTPKDAEAVEGRRAEQSAESARQAARDAKRAAERAQAAAEKATKAPADDAAAAPTGSTNDDVERQPVAGVDSENAATSPTSKPAGEAEPSDSKQLSFRGSITQGGLVVGHTSQGGTEATMGEQRLRIAPDGTFLVAFAHDAPKRQTLRLKGSNGESRRHVFDVAPRSFGEATIDGIPEEEVSPEDPETRAALAKAQKRVAEARARFTKEPYYRQGVDWPAKGRITSRYGVMRTFNDTEKSRHWGVDIAVTVGTAVKAPAGGVVRFAEADVPLSGGLIIIDHGHGLSSSLLHLSELDVSVGDEVNKGQVIARSGESGRATGPHLDWRMNLFQLPIDPQLVVDLSFR